MSSRERSAHRLQEGSALLLVVGATAAIGAVTLALLTASLLTYELAALERDGAQARVLTSSALDVVARELASGRLAVPVAGGAVLWQPTVPAAPAGMPALPPGCGFSVRLTRVLGPGGLPRQWAASPIPAELVDAEAEGRCGRGYSSVDGRFAVDIRGAVFRLY